MFCVLFSHVVGGRAGQPAGGGQPMGAMWKLTLEVLGLDMWYFHQA